MTNKTANYDLIKQKTEQSFRDKWTNNSSMLLDDIFDENSEIRKWVLERNGFQTGEELSGHLKGRRRILDAGCGAGRMTAFLASLAPDANEVVGIDLVSSSVAQVNLAEIEKVNVQECDILGDLSGLGKFDFIYCQEVIHHTPDPKQAVVNLSSILNDNGELAVYVYKKKAPIREYSDDFIRSKISEMAYVDAIIASEEIAELGRVLSNLKQEVIVPDVKAIGIDAGTYSIQRLMYHFFLKCFWNETLSAQENAAINYDWFHPEIASRHDASEVSEWFEAANLSIVHQCTDHYGITIRGVKNKSDR